MWSDLKVRFASLFHRAAMEREMDEEIRAHVQHETDKLVRAGVPRDEAHRRAVAAFGGIEIVKEHTRDARGTRWVEEAWHDVRHALKLLAHQKRFTAALILTMALGIGANTAVTAAIDEILWRPLTVPNADRIISVFEFDRSLSRYQEMSLPDIQDFGRASTLQAVAGYWRRPMRATFDHRIETVSGEVVTPGYFQVLAAPFVIGRPLSSDGEHPSAPVAVISERLWRARFGAAPNVIGQTLRLEAHNVPIVGVTSRQFRGDHNLNWSAAPDVWIPASAAPLVLGKRLEVLLRNRAVPVFAVLGLRRPDAQMAAAEAELNGIFAGVQSGNRAGANYGIKVFSASTSKFSPGLRQDFTKNLSVFGMAATLILLLAAANVANLLVERTTRRRREMAIRIALGAGRGRIVRQLFTEGLVLAAPGFVVSVLIAAGLQRVLSVFPEALGVRLFVDLSLTPRVLVYCGAVSIVIACVVSIFPAMRLGHEDPGPLLKQAVAGATRRHRSWISRSLTVVQIGVSAILLVGSLVIARGLWSAHTMPLGFDSSQTLVLSVDRFSPASDKPLPLPRNLLDRGAWLPAGATHIALASQQPLAGSASVIAVRGQDSLSPSVSADSYFVSGGFFDTLRVPVLAGRVFDGRDTATAQTAIVNEALARRLWGAQPALGRTMTIGGKSFEIVGVAADTRYRAVWEFARPQLFRPIGADAEHARVLLVRAEGPSSTTLPALTRAWTTIAPNVPIEEAVTGDELRSRATHPIRLAVMLIGAFALVAMGIAAVGLYSTMAWLVEQRSREMAIRIAVGGIPRRVAGGVMANALALTIAGSVIGFAVAIKLVPALSGLTHGMGSWDPWVVTASAVMLIGVSAIAAGIPTRRAARIDPIVILKSE
jgi:predicted permease